MNKKGLILRENQPFLLLYPIDYNLFLLEILDFLTQDFAQEEVGKAGCAEAQPLVGQPLFAQNFLHDGVVNHCIVNGVDAAGRLETNLNTSLLVVCLDSLAHHVSSLWSS